MSQTAVAGKPVECQSKAVCLIFSADLEALMRSLSIGPSDTGHGDHTHPHSDHDRTSARLKKRSSHVHHTGPEGNDTWDQVGRFTCLKSLAPRIIFFNVNVHYFQYIYIRYISVYLLFYIYFY